VQIISISRIPTTQKPKSAPKSKGRTLISSLMGFNEVHMHRISERNKQVSEPTNEIKSNQISVILRNWEERETNQKNLGRIGESL